MKISDKIKTLPIGDIKPYEKNAKLHTNEQIDLLRRSFETYGYYNPVGVDKNNVVIFGHGRLEAMKAKGETEIEVVCLDDLSPAEIKKLRILDNKIVSTDWDDVALQEEIDQIFEDYEGTMAQLKNECAMVIFEDVNFQAGSADEQGKLDTKKTIECPECHYKWKN
jgi:ParB-like chromosome segregation protein Spo0J